MQIYFFAIYFVNLHTEIYVILMKELPHPLVAAIPLVVLIGLLAVVIALFGSDSLSGGSQVSLLAAMAVCVFISIVFYKEPWKSFEQQIEKTVGGVAIMILILLAVGMLAGAWMISGVVPTLIDYGVQMLSPQFVDHDSHDRCGIAGYQSCAGR